MEVVAEAVEPKVEKKPGTFVKGEDPRRGDPGVAREKAKAPPEVALPDDGAPQQLQDMRHAYVNHRKYDRTEAHKTQRLFKEKSPKQFQEVMASLERHHRESVRATVQGPAEKDEGTERCLALIEVLVKQTLPGR